MESVVQRNPNVRKTTTRMWSTRRKMAEAYFAHLTGFGNTVRFSALLRENEISFLIPIAVSLIFIGVPLALLEVGLGHYTLKNVVHVWQMCPMAKGIFYVIFLTTLLLVLNMLIFLCYAMHYFVSFWGSELPWATCSTSWATENCFDVNKNISIHAACEAKHGADYCNKLVWEVSSLHYWKNAVLRNPNSFTIGFLNWNMLLYLFIICSMVALVNGKGIRSLEKFGTVFAYLPIACLTILIIMILRLPGAVKYIKAFWRLNLTKLAPASVWLGAVDVTFFSLSLGTLGLSFISSHGNFHDDILIDVVVLCFLDFISGLFFSFFIFGLKGSLLYREEIKKSVELLPGDLTNFHVWISQALININHYERIIAFVFYFNVILSGLGTMSYQVAAIMSAITGLFNSVRNHMFYLSFGVLGALYILAVIIFMTIGIHLPSIENSLVTTVFLQMIIIQFFYGCHKIADDFHFMMGYRPSIFFRVPWALSPIFLGAILYLKMYYLSSSDKNEIVTQGILIGAPFAIYLIAGFVDILIMKKKKMLKNIWSYFTQDSTWGPSAAILKKSRIVFNSQTVTKEYMYRQELFKKPNEKPFDFSKQNIVQQL